MDLALDWHPCEGIPSAVEVVAKGQVSPTNARRFIDVLESVLIGPVATLLLDTEQVPFVSSTALSYLADLIWHLEVRGGAVAFVRVHPKLKIVLTSLNLVPFFKFFDDIGAARAFAGEQAAKLRTQPRLVVIKGPGQGAAYPIGATPLTIGSDAASTIRVAAPRISPNHAEVSLGSGGCVVRDLGSKAGTLLNGRRVAEPTPLTAGAVLKVADLELRFETASG